MEIAAMADEQTTTNDSDDQVEAPAMGDDDEPGTLEDPGLKALREERSARKAADKAAKELAARLKEFEDRDKTEQQKLVERLEAAEARASQLESENLRTRIAGKHQIGEFADLLHGSEDDMNEQAKRLAKRFAAVEAREEPTDFNGGPRTPAKQPADPNDLIRSLRR